MNETNEYNLIDEPWIPVLMKNGKNNTASLGDVFADVNGEIADLALNPYERVAVFRLLLCIAQAALGPKHLKDEQDWLSAKKDVGPLSKKYLEKWHDRFFLYGPHAFLQPDCILAANEISSKPCDNLVFELASGNNSTLFDHAAIQGFRKNLPIFKLVLSLLVYQNFAAGGGAPQCKWDGVVTPFRGTSGAPCREQSMLFSILKGGYLLESIWLNLLTDETVQQTLCAEWREPIWELETLTRCNTEILSHSFLGHLVPLSRAIKLIKGATICNIGEGVKYPQLPEWREQMATVFDKSGKIGYISAKPSRMPWRDLTSILALNGHGETRSALALRHLETLPDEKVFSLWTGGIYWEPGQAKQIDTVEWSATLPILMLNESAMLKYETSINFADRQCSALRISAKTYASLMKSEKAQRFYEPAECLFWDILARAENQRLVLAVESPTYKDDWKEATRDAAQEAYRRACPAVTARQMEAYVQGLSKLNVREEI